jgi:hypothetical protein
MRMVGVLVSVAILAILLVVWLYYGTGGQSGGAPGAPPVSRVGGDPSGSAWCGVPQ